ncbi:MAG: MarR family transcriptional regulator [Clostridia bacterium]|nr:MarR family transcriptional regulator [Clostridia bacterium]MBQ3077600.1 MarR family transcriptional regulator [Clostridia bacterium]
MFSRYERFTAAVFSILRSIRKIERDEMERYGLNGAVVQYLTAMARRPQGVTAAELSELCDKDKAAVSRAVAELAREGLVCRAAEEGRAYRAPICLTEKGRELAERLIGRATLAVALAGESISAEERQVLYPALSRIAARLEQLGREGLPEQEWEERSDERT